MLRIFLQERLCNSLEKGVNKYIANLKTFFKYFLIHKVIVENPAQYIKLFKPPESTLRYLTDEEVNDIFKIIQGKSYYDMALFCLHTGTRIGETIELRWKNIDFKKGMEVLSLRMNGEFSLKTQKV